MANRAPDFRFIFASAIGLGVSDNDCKVIFGVEEGPNPQDIYEQIAVAMTLKTTKMLAVHLSTIVEHIEGISGEIPFDKEKQDHLKAVLNATALAPTALQQQP